MSFSLADKRYITNTVVTVVSTAINELIIPQFDEMHERFNKIEQRLDGHDRQLFRIDRRLSDLEQCVEELSGQLQAQGNDIKSLYAMAPATG